MKKILFDTSALLAGTLENHIHFKGGVQWIDAVREKRIRGYVSTHSVAEFFRHLSSWHFEPHISPLLALNLVEKSLMTTFDTIDLTRRDYLLAIKRVTERSLRGAIIYDSLHVQSALKMKINGLVTLNTKDFIRLVGTDELTVIDIASQKPDN